MHFSEDMNGGFLGYIMPRVGCYSTEMKAGKGETTPGEG